MSSNEVGKTSSVVGAISITSLLDIEAKYNELRLHIDGRDEMTHKQALDRLTEWRRYILSKGGRI